MMKIFGRNRESLRIKKVRASRAVFINQDVQEVEINLITEDGERLDLQLPSRLVPGLIQGLSIAYTAINPPLRSGDWQSSWQGME